MMNLKENNSTTEIKGVEEEEVVGNANATK
jgi:hypothetical protein